jgi:hypothetical protein
VTESGGRELKDYDFVGTYVRPASLQPPDEREILAPRAEMGRFYQKLELSPASRTANRRGLTMRRSSPNITANAVDKGWLRTYVLTYPRPYAPTRRTCPLADTPCLPR